MKIYKPHPAALTMPPMKAEEMAALKQSITERGQLFRAVLLDGKLLDGRNRQEAILQLVHEKRLPPSTELKVEEWHSQGGTPAGFVDAANDKRRHLTPGQRAMAATKLLPFFRKEAKERQREAAKKVNRLKKQPELIKSDTARGRGATAAQQAAKAAGKGVSARNVERAAFIAKSDAKLAKEVFEGRMSPKQAERKIRKRTQVAQAKAYVPPAGQFEVIVTDWPWKYGDELDGSGMERELPYPPQTIEEVCASIPSLPVATNCALFAWVTTPILIDPAGWAIVAAKLREVWGFEAKQMRTWVKTEADDGDFTGQGWVWRGDTEHLIRLERGIPTFYEMGEAYGKPLQRTSFRAPVGAHSEKPQKAYDDIEALCVSTSRLEMHARATRLGWTSSGSELADLPSTGNSVDAGAASLTSVEPGSSSPPLPRDAAPGSLVGEVHDLIEHPDGSREWTIPVVASSGTAAFDEPKPTPESVSAVPDDQLTF